MTGRDGVKLSEYWADGMRTMHGMHVHGFPNLFIVQAAQGANLISNVPHNLTEAGRTIALRSCARARQRPRRGRGHQGGRGRVGRAAAAPAPAGGVLGSADCTPGYYNNEGQPADGPGARLCVGYPGRAGGLLPAHRALAHRRSLRRPGLLMRPAGDRSG